MLKFHRKVNPKEGLIGFYKTGSILDESTITMYSYYHKLLMDPKNKGLLGQPLLFLIDPTMQNNRLSIKVSFVLFYELSGPFEETRLNLIDQITLKFLPPKPGSFNQID